MELTAEGVSIIFASQSVSGKVYPEGCVGMRFSERRFPQKGFLEETGYPGIVNKKEVVVVGAQTAEVKPEPTKTWRRQQ